MVGLAFLVAAALVLAYGADLYTRHARDLARRLSVSALAIGLLLAGAEPEELVTAVIASAHHHPGIAAGDAIGANVTMLTLVLGILVFLQPIRLRRHVRQYACAALMASALTAVLVTGGQVGRVGGAVLATGYVVFFVTVLYREHAVVVRTRHAGAVADPGSAPGDPIAARPGNPTPWSRALLSVVGLGFVVVGGRLAVEGATRFVASAGARDSAVGLTLVALATSAELFALMWAARRHEVTELALAALIGSVVGNATLTIGMAAVVRPLDTGGVVGAAWLAAALCVLFLVPALWAERRRRLVGGLLVVAYVLFVVAVL